MNGVSETLQDAITRSSAGTVVMENEERTMTNDTITVSGGTMSQGRGETLVEQGRDPGQETTRKGPRNSVIDHRKPISPSASRALRRTSTKAFLNKHRDGQRFTLYLHPECVS